MCDRTDIECTENFLQCTETEHTMANKPPVVDLANFKDLSQTGCSHAAPAASTALRWSRLARRRTRACSTTAHLVQRHGDDPTRPSCVKSTRHYARGRRHRERADADAGDAVFAFYEAIFDRFHHFVAHLFDVGLRVDTQLMEHHVNEEEEDKEGDAKEELVGAAFKKERAQIFLPYESTPTIPWLNWKPRCRKHLLSV